MLVTLEMQVAETVIDSEFPEVTASELRGNFPENENISFDIVVEYGLDESLRQRGEYFTEQGYSGILKRQEGSDAGCLVVCKFTPNVEEQETPVSLLNAAPRVYHCTPASRADGLILVLARSQEEAEQLITEHIDTDVDYLDISIDSTYDGITGEPRILEVVGFDCNCN